MPIYEYHCVPCDADFELLVRSDTVPACPHCHGAKIERLISVPAAPGTTQHIIANARRAAAKEGHFSNFSKAERSKLLKG